VRSCCASLRTAFPWERLTAGLVGSDPLGLGSACAVLPASLTSVRVTQKGQVTIPLEIRKALGIQAGSEVQFQLDADGARLVVGRQRAEREIARMRGAGDVDLSTDEILALTRR